MSERKMRNKKKKRTPESTDRDIQREMPVSKDGRWIILWREYSANTFLYGAAMHFLAKDDVEYDNPLLPPGTAVKTWMSKTNFQRDQLEPALPLIDGERSYRVHLEADCDVPSGLLLRFSFFQKNGTPEGNFVMRGTDAEFRCPIRTNDYNVELIAAGAHHFHFHYFSMEELQEQKDEKKETVSKRTE